MLLSHRAFPTKNMWFPHIPSHISHTVLRARFCGGGEAEVCLRSMSANFFRPVFWSPDKNIADNRASFPFLNPLGGGAPWIQGLRVSPRPSPPPGWGLEKKPNEKLWFFFHWILPRPPEGWRSLGKYLLRLQRHCHGYIFSRPLFFDAPPRPWLGPHRSHR